MGDFILTMLKFFLAVLMLPIVIATFVAFESHLTTYPASYAEFFRWGIFGFLVTFLFLYQFWGVYDFGQRMMQGLMSFLQPADRLISRLVPFYLTIVLLLFYVTKTLLGASNVSPYYMFFVGFAFAMHILLTAQEMQEEEKTPIKPTYFFWMSLVFVAVICLTVLLFDLVFDKWSFFKFITGVKTTAENIYRLSFERAFSF
ncbi:MAG TPA: hypothetical protein VI749_01495 [Candidatus Omnitrophota bacterium]|nr:hypothetical protein [Candidatus Omnitrophota bacterium]